MTQKPALTVLSLGWGVQSWTLAAMVALGELPMIDMAIHSDTTWERSETYEFARTWTPWLEERGVRVITVSDHNQAQAVKTAKTDIPAFSINEQGNRAQLKRQCTDRWKIKPMRRHIATKLKQMGLTKTPGIVEQWLGITLDEWHRAKDGDVKYIDHRFPLLEKDMTRADCAGWLQRHGLPLPVKSSCIFCPYHNNAAWQEIKRSGGDDWEQSVEIDRQIRDVRPPFPLFLHAARIPLEEAVSIPEDEGASQLSLDIPDNECDSGYCFL